MIRSEPATTADERTTLTRFAGIEGASLDAVAVGPSRSGWQFSLRWCT